MFMVIFMNKQEIFKDELSFVFNKDIKDSLAIMIDMIPDTAPRTV